MQYLRRSVSRNRKVEEDDQPERIDVKEMDRKELEATVLDLQKKLR